MVETTRSPRSPLLLGVSGHRNLHPDAEAEVRQYVEQLFAALKLRMPHTEVRVLVGMAQGADLLAAQVAVQAGLHVDALLPMPLEQYADDFEPASLAALETLLKNPSVRCTVLRSPQRVDANASCSARDRLYANLREALIAQCHLLLAVWNGEPSLMPGGTADTVLRYLGARTIPEPASSDVEIVNAAAEPASASPFVYWIPAMRTDDRAPTARAPAYLSGIGENLLAVHNAMPRALAHQLAELNAYNQEFERLDSRRAFPRLDALLPALGAVDADGDRDALERIDAEYGRADALAVHYQRRSDSLFRWFSYMASCMALIFLVYAKLYAGSVLLAAYLALLALGLVVFHQVRDRHWFSKHLVYRAFAETMRTRFFLRAAGADRLVNAGELIQLTGIDQFSGFSWMRNVLRSTEPPETGAAMPAAMEQARLERVRQRWICGQKDYLASRTRKLEREQRLLQRTKTLLLCAIATLAIALLVFSDALRAPLAGPVTYKDAVIFFMGLLPVWLGVWELYQNKMATRELLWQYRNQLGHFTRADLQLSRTASIEQQKSMLAQVGRKSLMESYLWTIHRYHREYEPPSAT